MNIAPIVIATVLVSSALFAQSNSASANSSAKFAALSEEFIHTTLALAPSNASQAGYHLHKDPKTGKFVALDALLDDVSAAGWAEQRRVYAEFRERFRTETPVASLGPEDAADWRLIDDQIGQQLLELDRIQNYKHNPTVYVELLGGRCFSRSPTITRPKTFGSWIFCRAWRRFPGLWSRRSRSWWIAIRFL